jgi:hypothetical protein
MAELSVPIRDLLPRGKAGLSWAKTLANSLVRAHALAPNGWGLSPVSGLLRLNLGMIEVLTVSPVETRLIVDIRGLRSRSQLLEAGLLEEYEPLPERGVFKSVRGSAVCYAWDADNGSLLDRDIRLDVNQAHIALLAGAALTRRNPTTSTGHSTRAVAALGDLVGRTLPLPTHAIEP